MDVQEEYVLICAPTKAGEQFIKLLKMKGCRFAGLANNPAEKQRLAELGVEKIFEVDTRHLNTWLRPPFPVGRIYLFESSVALCCRYVQMCRTWTSGPISVITTSMRPRLVYKGLGADNVIYSHSGQVGHLAAECE
ncbi:MULTISPECIES: hypothetical protein [Paenibacillus]|uniref:hypothetical protein n=1 Tax=Paenibacillus TaxID=44249 RepID=UPI00076C62C1|nr:MULTISPECIES: hypothetical protein [Paenibacillus]KUP24748.1 hypothetical protein AWJ19_30100 [Paenibacillus sp. DMB5]MBY0012427.1 hypothetical protein [Paenibacillus typhae]